MNKEQIEKLAKLIHQKSMNLTLFEAEILVKNWFEQNIQEPAIGITDIRPNWEDAPEWANFCAKNLTGEWAWYEKEPSMQYGDISTKWTTDGKTVVVIDNTDWKDTLQQRPNTPAPRVEVGQVWTFKTKGSEYIVEEVIVLEGKTKIGEWQDNFTLVVYIPANVKGDCKSKDIYRRPLEDFLAKFEQVQS
jgi:hypothetical protein